MVYKFGKICIYIRSKHYTIFSDRKSSALCKIQHIIIDYNSSCSNMKSPCNQKWGTIAQVYQTQITLPQYTTTHCTSVFSVKDALTEHIAFHVLQHVVPKKIEKATSSKLRAFRTNTFQHQNLY